MRNLGFVDRLWLIAYAIGVFVSYGLMAFYQEKVYKNNYNGDFFTFPSVFVAVQCVFSFIAASGLFLIFIIDKFSSS
jgi:hypothetical protein